MPRTCLACASPEREQIDSAIIAGEPLRNIAKRVSISPAALLRHKPHIANAIVQAGKHREERLGENLLEEMRRVQRKAWELVGKTESDGDHRGSIVALREVRECIACLGEMLAKATELNPQEQEVRVRIVQVGELPADEWEELPESYNALLPGKPQGRLCIRRKPPTKSEKE